MSILNCNFKMIEQQNEDGTERNLQIEKMTTKTVVKLFFTAIPGHFV